MPHRFAPDPLLFLFNFCPVSTRFSFQSLPSPRPLYFHPFPNVPLFILCVNSWNPPVLFLLVLQPLRVYFFTLCQASRCVLLLLFAASAGFVLFHSPDFRLFSPHGRESWCINTAFTVNLWHCLPLTFTFFFGNFCPALLPKPEDTFAIKLLNLRPSLRTFNLPDLDLQLSVSESRFAGWHVSLSGVASSLADSSSKSSLD